MISLGVPIVKPGAYIPNFAPPVGVTSSENVIRTVNSTQI